MNCQKTFCLQWCATQTDTIIDNNNTKKFHKLSLKGIVNDIPPNHQNLWNSQPQTKLNKIKSQSSFHNNRYYHQQEPRHGYTQRQKTIKDDDNIQQNICLDFNKKGWEKVMNKQSQRICLATSERTTYEKRKTKQTQHSNNEEIEHLTSLKEIQDEIRKIQRQYQMKLHHLNMLKNRIAPKK